MIFFLRMVHFVSFAALRFSLKNKKKKET